MCSLNWLSGNKRVWMALVASCLLALLGCSAGGSKPIAATPPANTARLEETAAGQEKADAAAAEASDPAPEDTADQWPMFRGNSLLNGVAAQPLPQSLAILWTFKSEAKNDSIESSPAIVDDTVYIGTIGGYLYAIDIDSGSPRWRYSTVDQQAAGDASVDLPPAIKSSPTLAHGKVYFGDEIGIFHCLDAKTGDLKWKFDTETGAEIVSSANVVGDRVLFGSWDENLYCLSADDGKELWKFKTGGPVNCTPAVVQGRTFLSGCDTMLRVVNIDDGSELGSCEMESQTGASPAVSGDRLYVGHMGCQVLGIDWSKPAVEWRYEHPTRQFEFYSSAAATPEVVVVGGRDKLVHALDAATGEPRWTFPTKGRVDSSPAIAGDRVFIGSHDGNVYGLDLATGKEAWSFATGGKVISSPAIAGGRLVIANDAGHVFCFGAKQE